MEIWLDTSLQDEQSRSGECEGDGECYECGVISSLPSSVSLLAGNMRYGTTSRLQQIVPLHRQEISPGRWLISNPTQLGKLAVLDTQAFSLLEEFHTPNTLSAVRQKLGVFSFKSVEKAVTLFYQLGFLYCSNQPLPTHQEGRADTVSAWLHVTNSCNLRCHYCYIHKTPEHMTDTIGRQSIDAVFRSARKQGFKRVKLRYAGGEASLHMSSVQALHEYAIQQAQEHGLILRASILSNGVVLSDQIISYLKERNISVMISLDGLEAYHDSQRPFINGKGSFKYVDRTISRLLTCGLAPHISVTVSQRNQGGLPDLLTYIMEREMTFSLNLYRDNDCSAHIADLQFREEEMITAIQAAFAVIKRKLPAYSLLGSLLDKTNLRFPHSSSCGVGQNYFAIDQQGGIAKCHANIKQTTTTILADDPLQVIRDDAQGIRNLSVDEKVGCRTCEWRYWCGGGCPLLTYRITGRNDVKSPNCNIYKALFPAVLQLEALRLMMYVRPIVL